VTEIPEHLLARSKARRAALGQAVDGDIAEASAPAANAAVEKSAASAPAAASSAAVAVAPETPVEAAPIAPYVEASIKRKKIPIWASSVLALLPVWALVYGLTLDPPTPREAGPRAQGAITYGSCSSCHGAGGGGGVGPALTKSTTDFTTAADQMEWVLEGTKGFQAQGRATYGATNKPVGGGGVMPAFPNLTAQEIIGVIRHEREVFSGEKFDLKSYDEILAMIEAKYPDRLAEFKEAIDQWKTLPSDA